MAELVCPKLSYKIIGILYKVHQELGPHLLEKYYQRAVALELDSQEMEYQREFPVEIFYQKRSVGRYFLDFVIEHLIILEIKAQKAYSKKYLKQVLAYLRQTNLPLAIIANFRRESLEYVRVINPDFKNKRKGLTNL